MIHKISTPLIFLLLTSIFFINSTIAADCGGNPTNIRFFYTSQGNGSTGSVRPSSFRTSDDLVVVGDPPIIGENSAGGIEFDVSDFSASNRVICDAELRYTVSNGSSNIFTVIDTSLSSSITANTSSQAYSYLTSTLSSKIVGYLSA